MRPRRLELKGFTAFRDKQVVDLATFDLFVITGPTGAGKTSLLDALALALYGKVPRMGGDGLGQLVSHGQPDAAVLLEFDIDDTHYRVSRRLPRTGTQTGRLERRDGEDWVDAVERGGITPINQKIAEQLMKLDFKSFCKAILLPQGEFAQFLKGDAAERRRTLVALLELEVYERMRKLAARRAKELTIRGDQTRAILAEQFSDATAETLADTATTLKQASDRADELAQTLARAKELETERETTAARGAALAGLADRLAEIQQDAAAEVDGARESQAAYEQAAADRTEAAAEVDARQRRLAEAQARRDSAAGRFGDREALARAIDAVGQREQLDIRILEADTQLAAATRRHRDCTEAAERTAATRSEAERRLQDARAANEAAQQDATRLAAERDALQQRLDAAVVAGADQALAERELGEREEAATSAERASVEAHSRQEQAQAALDQLKRGHLVAALAAHLQPGDPCPVCERPLVEHPARDPDIELQLTDAEQTLADAKEDAETAQKAAAHAAADRSATADRAARAREAVATALGDSEHHGVLESLVNSANEAASTAAQVASEHARERGEADEAAQQAALAATQAASERDAAAAALELRQGRLEEASADRQTALDVLHGCFGEAIPADAAAQLESAYRELTDAEQQVGAASAARAAAQASLTKADEVERNALSALNAVDVRMTQLRTRAEAALGELAAISDPPSLPVLPDPSDARELNVTELSSWGDRTAALLHTASGELEHLTARLAADIIKLAADYELAAEDAAAAFAAIEAAERHAVDGRIRAATDHGALARRVEQRAELEAGIAEDQTRIAVLKVLATELRSDHFTEYVLQETLDALAVRASEELLRISDDRYSLVSRDGEFFVVDHINADEQRSVRTLSGGETFIASLSLALALSKHVTELAGEGLGARLEAVFIDEGFGSLDPESLGEVIDALERLREADLLVGVISHVPELAERVGVGLQVRKEGNRSVVEPR